MGSHSECHWLITHEYPTHTFMTVHNEIACSEQRHLFVTRMERYIAILISYTFQILFLQLCLTNLLPMGLINKAGFHKQHKVIHYTFLECSTYRISTNIAKNLLQTTTRYIYYILHQSSYDKTTWPHLNETSQP